MISEKIAYLKGLCEGMKIDESTNEGKLFGAIIDALDEFVNEIYTLEDTQDELQAQIDEIDDDLAFVEDYLFDDMDDDECFDFDVEDIECPYCGEPIAIDADILDSEDDCITCPACGKEFELEFESCGCGCDDCCDCGDEGENEDK
ncbi:MAG: hypothetical protein J5590_09070 [Clostridia bacterium]|nr:hypothetical protein [Clostridia bacterium]